MALLGFRVFVAGRGAYALLAGTLVGQGRRKALGLGALSYGASSFLLYGTLFSLSSRPAKLKTP